MTGRRLQGAYARRDGDLPVTELPPIEEAHHGPQWQAVVMTSLGYATTPSEHEHHARGVNRLRRVQAEQGVRTNHGSALLLGGYVLSPALDKTDGWGEDFDPQRPRWHPLTWLTHWSTCVRCDAEMWPGRVVPAALRFVEFPTPLCLPCLRRHEVADPRPLYPVETTTPPPRPQKGGESGKDKGFRRRDKIG